MTYTRKNKGVCSNTTTVTLEDGIVRSVLVDDGCDGNLKAVMQLLQGMRVEDAIAKIRGITCENKSTSCPDQISICLQEALEKQNS